MRNKIKIWYDKYGKMVRRESGLDIEIWKYNDNGLEIEYTDSEGSKKITEYDDKDRIIKQETDKIELIIKYDDINHSKITTMNGKKKLELYDECDNLIYFKMEFPEAIEEWYKYDDNHRLINKITRKNNIEFAIEYTYDEYDNVISACQKDDKGNEKVIIRTEYNENNKPIHTYLKDDKKIMEEFYTYHDNGKTTKEMKINYLNREKKEYKETILFDKNDNLLERRLDDELIEFNIYDENDNLIFRFVEDAEIIYNNYELNDCVETYIFTFHNRSFCNIKTKYDKKGRILSESEFNGSEEVTTFLAQYDDNDNLLYQKTSDSETYYDYYPNGRLKCERNNDIEIEYFYEEDDLNECNDDMVNEEVDDNEDILTKFINELQENSYTIAGYDNNAVVVDMNTIKNLEKKFKERI